MVVGTNDTRLHTTVLTVARHLCLDQIKTCALVIDQPAPLKDDFVFERFPLSAIRYQLMNASCFMTERIETICAGLWKNRNLLMRPIRAPPTREVTPLN
jgi:hypothetical protein